MSIQESAGGGLVGPLTPALAAGVTGWFGAPAAIDHGRVAALPAGALTYASAGLLYAILMHVDLAGSFSADALSGIGLLWFLGMLLLLPVLLLCVAAGLLWAWILARTWGSGLGGTTVGVSAPA